MKTATNWWIACNRESFVQLVEQLEIELQEVGGCDHSVGICCCGLECEATELKEMVARLPARARVRMPGEAALTLLNDTCPAEDLFDANTEPAAFAALAGARRDVMNGIAASGTVVVTDRRCARLRTGAPGEKCVGCWEPLAPVVWGARR